jgi:hypothetical protein
MEIYSIPYARLSEVKRKAWLGQGAFIIDVVVASKACVKEASKRLGLEMFVKVKNELCLDCPSNFE